ncbi:MAG: hypothetical protein D9N14_01030 [Ketobacter sp.]|nr:MAG: hypothetical protein D9N14_01030 [Ketobacter sp.]
MTLDNSYEDEQFHQANEEAQQYLESIEATQARVEAFSGFVDGLDAMSETYESVQADPYDYGFDHQDHHYDHAVDGMFMGVAAGIHMSQQIGRACHDYFSSHSEDSSSLEETDLDNTQTESFEFEEDHQDDFADQDDFITEQEELWDDSFESDIADDDEF